ncbi:MAG: wax ester/triacylglycerol synthase family O-acyltransferase [Haliea sp.]|jgi:WS/DGAT/MGAT family acyltransferase|nr:wax ester/triacylglycerol synthase family O-acyltransferase [Haliea sp.]
MANRKIPPLDLMFYLTETAQSPKHVGAVQIFKLPAKAPKSYMRDLVQALKEAPVAAPFNQRPHFPRLGYPEWQKDQGLDIDYHVRHSALPAPGTDEQLLEVLSRLHCGLLSRDRPGWICQVIEGLEGRRFAIYSKIHHAYIDGMSGVKRMYATLSTSPRQKHIIPTWSYVADKAGDTSRSRKPRSGAAPLKSAMAQARAVSELSEVLARNAMAFLVPRERKDQGMFHAPRTRMNDRVEYDTRAIATCSLPLDKARAIASEAGGKVNDVVLAVIDAALHDYLEEHGENTDAPLVALCPMSVREASDDSASTQATALHVRLGEPGASPADRLNQVIESSMATKKEARTLSREALVDFALVMVGALELADHTPLGRFLSPSYNVLVSNVPGPAEDVLYLRGSRQLASYPISAFLPGSNLNITVLSHGNKLDFGLVADKQALPDLPFVARAMEHNFALLQESVL